MKKNIIVLIIGFLSFNISAQDAADKKVQAGLVTGFGLNFQNMGTKLMESNGVGTDFTIGANVNFQFTETIGFNTGVEFDFETLKYRSGPTNVYYNYSDNEIRQKDDIQTTDELFRLSTRKEKPVYLTIPTMLLFQTKFIGYFRYFGKFGVRTSVLLKNSIIDEGFNFDPDNVLETEIAGTNENMTAAGDMFFLKSAVGLSGGAEWNFTGTTCAVFELGYYYGITPLHFDQKEGKRTLYTSGLNNGAGNDNFFSNQASQSQLMFKASILF